MALTAAAQALIFAASGSLALLADLIHNVGDAATAVPLGVAFALRNVRLERWAGIAVVLAVLLSACLVGIEAIQRLIAPQTPDHLPAVAAAGIIGFLGNRVAAAIRGRAGHQLASPALIADANHARADAWLSLAVVLSAGCVAAGIVLADPLIGLAITVLILRITWHSWQTVKGYGA